MSDKDKPKDKVDLSGLIGQIKGIDSEAFHDALKSEAPDHYNKVFRTGYGTAKGEYEPKIKASSDGLTKLQEDIAAKEAKIKELTEKTPDLAKLEATYELTLQQKADEIENLKKEYGQQLTERDGLVLSERKDGFNANFVRKLVELGVDKDYAEVLVAKGSTQERIKWGNEKQPKVYQEDGQTPFPQADGKQPYAILATDLIKAVPDKFINDRKPSDPGFGSRPGDAANFENLGEEQKTAFLEKMWAGRL